MENNDIQAQGFLDIFKLFDSEVIEKVSKLMKTLDVDKIKQIMDAIEVKEDRVNIKLDLTIKR